jgi:CRP-like cAMP-binding protein
LIDAAIFREWIVNLGSRSAEQRAAHMMLELKERLKVIRNDDEEFELPISQEELGDAIGTTAVHANRVLKALRDQGLVTFRKRTVTIHNLQALEELGDFDPLYLHHNPASL